MVKPKSGRSSQPRRLPAAQRREQLLGHALAVFAARGFHGTGTRDLAAAAGVTEPVLYRHFESKAALFEATVERAGEQLAEALDGPLAAADTPQGRVGQLAAHLPRLLAAQREALSVLLYASMSDDPNVLAAGGRAAEAVGTRLGDAFKGSALRPGVDPHIAGFTLFQLGMGASVLRRLPVPTMDQEEYPRTVVDILLGGVA